MKPKVCIITFPMPSESIYPLLFDLVKVVEPSTSELIVVSGNVPNEYLNGNYVLFDIKCSLPHKNLIKPKIISTFKWILINLLIQIKILKIILKLEKVDIIIFFIGLPYVIFPILASKIKKIKVVCY